MMRHPIVLLLVLFVYYATASNIQVCTNGFTLINNKCLKLFTNPLNHTTAERICMDYGATLVTSKNAIDNRAITTVAGTSASLLWMGLYCFDSDLSKCLWDDSTGTPEMYNSFASGFPLVDIGKCVYYSVQGALAGKWLSGDCDHEARAFVCELPTTHADNCTYNYNGYCYTFHGPAAFVSAQTSCEQEFGNLVSIHSSNENRYLNTIVNRAVSGNLMLGAMWSSTNVFSWVDGSMWTYNNIDTNYGRSGACVMLSTNSANGVPAGLWFSDSCSASYSFACKRPAGLKMNGTPPPVIVTPLPSNPSYCNSGLIMAPGVITSPNYPNNYDNNVYCTYQLATLGAYNILLRFSTFVTESCCDHVFVFDGDSVNSQLFGNYSGSRSAFSLISSGNTMLVAFKTDSSQVFQGFSARFTSYSYGR